MTINIRKPQIIGALTVVATWLAMGTLVYHSLEKWTWIQSLYFSTVTLTTVGYGDLHPTTDFARLVTVFYILFGVAAVVSAVSVIGSERVAKRVEKLEKRKER